MRSSAVATAWTTSTARTMMLRNGLRHRAARPQSGRELPGALGWSRCSAMANRASGPTR